MNWTLEVVVVPVTDVDRAKSFYADQLGFNVDHDTKVSDEMRFVQLTPPGSGCSIVVGKGVTDMQPGSIKGLQLVVSDIVAAHAQLVERGVEVGDVTVYDGDMSRLDPGRNGPRQRRLRVLQRSRRQRLGGAADLGPRLARQEYSATSDAQKLPIRSSTSAGSRLRQVENDPVDAEIDQMLDVLFGTLGSGGRDVEGGGVATGRFDGTPDCRQVAVQVVPRRQRHPAIAKLDHVADSPRTGGATHDDGRVGFLHGLGPRPRRFQIVATRL